MAQVVTEMHGVEVRQYLPGCFQDELVSTVSDGRQKSKSIPNPVALTLKECLCLFEDLLVGFLFRHPWLEVRSVCMNLSRFLSILSIPHEENIEC